jgi:DnaJ-domain-containing protein 1
LKNYYHILGLETDASEQEIRKAFRALAKKYHPDVNADEDARHRFIEVEQAYSFLINDAQRRNYTLLLREEKMSQSEQAHRENIYKLWVEHQQRKAKTRTAMESVYSGHHSNPFERKMWRGLNLFYNILFMIVFLFMLVMPIVNYVNQLDKPENQQRSIVFFLIPFILGTVFLLYSYYYWFVLKGDQE